MDKIKDLFGLDRAREVFNEWTALLPAKSNLDSEYNFPTARYAGAGMLGWKKKDKGEEKDKEEEEEGGKDTDKGDKD